MIAYTRPILPVFVSLCYEKCVDVGVGHVCVFGDVCLEGMWTY